jgi:DeoR/GlpR family transcriptional regulator of sugar metabolism
MTSDAFGVIMLTKQRKQLILQKLKKDGQIVAKQMSRSLRLSEDTIRRDLRELAQEGLLQRVHGGALPASPAVVNFAGREQLASAAKIAIGKAAASMIQRDQVVILDGGTTTRELARHLPRDLRATIVTHSPTIAMELVEHPTVDVILIGGRLFKHSVVAVGAAAIEAIGLIRADTYFMGVTGIHPEVGLSTGDMEEAHIKRALSAAAADTIVLVSAEKLNAASPYIIAPVTEATGIIVERDTPQHATEPYEKLGIAVTRA